MLDRHLVRRNHARVRESRRRDLGVYPFRLSELSKIEPFATVGFDEPFEKSSALRSRRITFPLLSRRLQAPFNLARALKLRSILV
jgi:hypothetical protein